MRQFRHRGTRREAESVPGCRSTAAATGRRAAAGPDRGAEANPGRGRDGGGARPQRSGQERVCGGPWTLGSPTALAHPAAESCSGSGGSAQGDVGVQAMGRRRAGCRQPAGWQRGAVIGSLSLRTTVRRVGQRKHMHILAPRERLMDCYYCGIKILLRCY